MHGAVAYSWSALLDFKLIETDLLNATSAPACLSRHVFISTDWLEVYLPIAQPSAELLTAHMCMRKLQYSLL